ncbi:MAG: hypothetical protein Q8N88_05565 [Nanoarchaeota archaeon]|nr:hypothetical protein [Nanoarchaeota archaeon]
MKNEENKEKRIFMKPGKNNREDRLNFIEFWANYIKAHKDEEWSKQQNFLINSQIKNARNLRISKEDYLKLKNS